MIEVKNVYKSFNDAEVLKDISARFERGITNLIIGQSGSGKTVLLKSIVGLHEIDSGEIFYEDVEYSSMNFQKKKLIRQKIGMLFQGSALFDSLTVEENVRFQLDMFSAMTPAEKIDRVNFCLKRVNLENANQLYPSELSGGMKKRVAIARAIVMNPSFLFCDEPNSGLDPKTSIVIDNLIKEITEEFNMTTIINTHDMNSVMEIGDKIIFIFEGEKWWEGTKNEVFKADNEELRNFVFATELMKTVKKHT
jgi:phospholipid/cholesterol/gamma-HCH transport system ATP-binding protein